MMAHDAQASVSPYTKGEVLALEREEKTIYADSEGYMNTHGSIFSLFV